MMCGFNYLVEISSQYLIFIRLLFVLDFTVSLLLSMPMVSMQTFTSTNKRRSFLKTASIDSVVESFPNIKECSKSIWMVDIA